jgi:hypothetical protein
MGQLRDSETGKRSGGEAAKIIGSVLSIEIVPSACGFHVHGHLLLFCRDPLDYSVYDPEKKRALILKYGRGNVPPEELDKVATKKIQIADNVDEKLIGDGVAVSKLSEQWHAASGAINFWVGPLVDRYIRGKFKTIENQLYESIKYITKSWILSGPDMLKLWDTIHNKKRITKSGIFTNSGTGLKDWYGLLEKSDLVDEFDKLIVAQKPDEISYSIDSCYDQVFDYEKFEYTYLQREADFSYLATPEYKKFMSDRAGVVNAYRLRVGEMVDALKAARAAARLGGRRDVDPDFLRSYIIKKELARTSMKKKVHDLINGFSRFIHFGGPFPAPDDYRDPLAAPVAIGPPPPLQTDLNI